MQATILNQKNDFPPDKLKIITKAFFNLTSHWQLTREEEASLLGWDYQQKRTTLDSLRKGKTFMDRDDDKIERIVDLINIHKCLRVLFPYNREDVYAWVKKSRERFGGFSALHIMLTQGRWGIMAIRHYLENERTH